MPQKTQNTISETALKHYNKLRSVRNEALRWVQIATDTGKNLKFETAFKERYQQLLDFIAIDVVKIQQQHRSSQDIITIIMNTIINSSFTKHPM